tara:strand:+ start:17149 stop:18039 length:891 start_codon:yes stop_codon:yes gene_type:complete
MHFKMSVIIPVHQAEKNITEIMNALRPHAYPQVQFIFCYLNNSNRNQYLTMKADNIQWLLCAENSLIPHMWRDGIKESQADIVAFTTAHFIPSNNWVETALLMDMDKYVAVGGSIRQTKTASCCDWAIYIQRYINFMPSRKTEIVSDVAADNAIYRKKDILQEAKLLKQGFWEPSFHRKFVSANKCLLFEPSLEIIHKNQYSKVEFFKQRFAHGIAFGRERSKRLSTFKRSIMLLLAPGIPLIFLRKLYRATKHQKILRSKFVSSFLCLCYFILGWSLGEVVGYIHGNEKEKTNDR